MVLNLFSDLMIEDARCYATMIAILLYFMDCMEILIILRIRWTFTDQGLVEESPTGGTTRGERQDFMQKSFWKCKSILHW